MPKKYYSVKEAAKLIGVSTNTLYTYLNENKLKARRIGKGRFKIPYSELSSYVPSVNEVAPFVPLKDLSFLDAFKGSTYGKGDFIFFQLFLGFFFLGTGVLTLLYKLSIYTPTDSLLFFLIPFVTMAPGVLMLLEIFGKDFKKYHLAIHVLATLVAGYSSYFSFVFKGYESFAVYVAILFVLVSELIWGHVKGKETSSFEKDFLVVLFVIGLAWTTVAFFIPGSFALFAISASQFPDKFLFWPLWLIFGALPILALFSPRLKKTFLDWLILPAMIVLAVAIGVSLSSEGKWLASYYFYLIAIFEGFLLWWRKRKTFVDAKLSPAIAIALFWMSLIAFFGAVIVGLTQRSMVSARVERAGATLSGISRQTNSIFESIDRQIATAIQDSEVQRVIENKSIDAGVAESRKLFDSIPNIRRVVIVDASGVVLGVYPREGGGTSNTNLSDRDYFKVVKNTLKPYTSDVFTSLLGAPLAVRVHPVIKNNEFFGIVLVAPDLYALSLDFNEELAFGSSFYGVDKNGNYVFHPDPRGLGQKAPGEILEQAQGGVFRDTATLRVFERVESTGWTFYLESPLSFVLADLIGLNLMIGVIILLTSGFGFFVLEGISKRWIKV